MKDPKEWELLKIERKGMIVTSGLCPSPCLRSTFRVEAQGVDDHGHA